MSGEKWRVTLGEWQTRAVAAGWGIIALLLLSGCAASNARLHDARQAFFRADLSRAIEELNEIRQHDQLHRDVATLDLAMAHLVAGRPDQAEALLREVRDRFDYLEQDSAAETAWSMATDDRRLAYAGEDYEKVLVRVMLAMSNLMGQGDDAGAYCLQVNAKQQEIIQQGAAPDGTNPKLAYQPVAVGTYLYGIVREATHANYDDAQRCYAQVVSWQPDFTQGQADWVRVQSGVHSQPGNGVVYVFGLIGQGPVKREVSEQPTSNALLLADRIVSLTADHSLPPTVAPIRVPQVVVRPSAIDGLLVAEGEAPLGVTQTITDVSELAVRQQEAVHAYIVARAVARRALKKAAVYAVKSHLDVNNPWLELAWDLAGVAWEGTESADTRCWGLLPDKIQVLRIELPAGTHQLVVQPLHSSRPAGARVAVTVPVYDGGNTYVMAWFAGGRLIGNVLVGG